MPEEFSNLDPVLPDFRRAEYYWIRRRLTIDTMDLDSEIIELPNLIQSTGEYTAAASELCDAAENDLKVTTSLVAEQLRRTDNPSGKHRSETQITSELPSSPLIREKQDALSKARLDSKLWSVLMESLRKKDSGIRTIADLLNSGFLSSASITEKRRKEIRNVRTEKVEAVT